VSQPQPPWNPRGQQPPQNPRQPPPGWYPDPGGQQILRWWDGTAWAPHTQPMPVEPQPPYPGATAAGAHGPFVGQQGGTGLYMPDGPQGGTTYGPSWPSGPGGPVITAARPRPAPGPWAWAVASAPLLLLGIAALAALLVGVNVGVSACLLIGALVADAFAIFAAYRDTRALRAAGEPVSSGLAWWCLLVPWAYLWARAVKRVNRTGTDWGLLVVAVAAWLVIIVIGASVVGSAVTTGAVFEQAQVQSQIASGIEAKSGIAVTVSCPQDPPLNPGSQFQCVATAPDGSTTLVTVTIQDRSGDYLWQTTGG
jgi:hypothetical protein